MIEINHSELTPHAAAILERLQEKPFMHGYPSAMAMGGYAYSASDQAMRASFAALVAMGLVVEIQQGRALSRYELAEGARG